MSIIGTYPSITDMNLSIKAARFVKLKTFSTYAKPLKNAEETLTCAGGTLGTP